MVRMCRKIMVSRIALRVSRGLFATVAMAGLLACGGGGGNNNVVAIPLQPLTVDVLSALVTPSYTLNGTAFDEGEDNDGNLILRSTTSAGDTALLGSSHFLAPAPVRIVQGSYDVLFQHETGNGVPQNVNSPVQANVLLNSNQALPIAVTSVIVSPSFTLNGGGSFPATEDDDGVFYLQPNTGGERIFLGNSRTSPAANVQVMPGFYDVIYVSETSGTQAPLNQSAVIMSAVDLTADTGLMVDVDSVNFSFNATLDTMPFPVSINEHAVFSLRNVITGDIVELGVSYVPFASVPVVAGTYDIIYRYVQGDALPVNADATVASGVVISDADPAETIDVTSALITPSFTLNGSAFEATQNEGAKFFLRGITNTNDEMLLGASYFASPDPVRVVSSTLVGNYDVLYRHEDGTTVPQNTSAVVQTNVALSSDMSFVVDDVVSVEITGRFTLNGNNFPSSIYDSTQFLLRGDDESDVFLLGLSDISNESVNLISGMYDVIIDHVDGDAVPQNKMHIVKFNELLTAGATLFVNVNAKQVDASFSLDGSPFPLNVDEIADFNLRDVSTQKLIFVSRSDANSTPVMVVEGTYDMIYTHTSGAQIPQNTNSVVATINVQ